MSDSPTNQTVKARKARFSSLVRQLKKAKSQLSKDRDRLRILMAEYQDVLESTEEACYDLDHVIERLSQYM